MIKSLPKSLIESVKKVLEESNTPKLKHIAEVKTNFPDADYYIVRKGSLDTIGKVTTEFSPEHIGVKITHEGVLPKYHQYAMQYAHMNGYWKQKGKGSLNLQHISVDDVKNMPAIYQGLNESVIDTHIDVDGELKHRYNSEGKLIHPSDEGIRNFHRWFGKSTFTDSDGKPLVVYHGAKPKITMKLDNEGNPEKTDDGEFNLNYHSPDIHQFHYSPNGSLGSGVYVTSSKKEAEDYTEGKGTIYPLYVNGTHIRKENRLGITNWTVHPHQLKSALGNDGSFDHPFRIHENHSITTDNHYSLLEWKNAVRKLGAYVYQTDNINEEVGDIDIWYASHKDNKNINGQFFKGKELQCGHISYPTKEDIPLGIIESFFNSNSSFQSNNCFYDCDFSLNESLDTKYKLHDMTELALQQNPEIKKQNDIYGITNYKVEFHPETNQVFTTFHRDGAWEIHHQKDDKVGQTIQSSTPPLGFSAHVLNFIKEKIDKKEKVRVNSTKEMINTFHKKAKNISEKIGAEVTPVEKGIDPHQTGLDIHEFLIYPKSLKENLLPLQFSNPHEKMRFLYEHFGDIPVVKEYKEKLIKQGHSI